MHDLNGIHSEVGLDVQAEASDLLQKNLILRSRGLQLSTQALCFLASLSG